MINQLENLTIDQGNHKSNCGNCSDDADCSCNLLSKPKNSGCAQEGDCSCKGNIGNETKKDCSCGLTGTNCKAVKNKKSPKADWGCEQDCKTGECNRECGVGGPRNPEEKAITQIESFLIPNLIFEVFPKAKVEYLKQFNNYEKDSVTLFNYLKAGENKPVPSEAVDEIWHNMILYTARYGDFCRKYFGRFVHHIPNDKKILAEDQPNCRADGCGLEPCSCNCNPDGQGKCKNGR